MDFTEWERQQCQRKRAGQWAEAYAAVNDLLGSTDKLEQSFGLMMQADTRFSHSSEFVVQALESTDQALGMLTNLELIVRAAINGFHMAEFAGDSDRMKQYCDLMRCAETAAEPQVAKWAGRSLNTRAHHAVLTNRLDRALELHAQSLAWHRKNIGPFDAHDQACHVRMALTGYGEVCLLLGKRNRAGACLKEAKEIADADPKAQKDTIFYLSGLLAASAGDHISAVKHLHDAMDCCGMNHTARLRISVMLALEYSNHNEYHNTRTLLKPLIHECAFADLPNVVLRLQRLTQILPPKEGEFG